MAYFYPFPGSCAVQVYSGFGYGYKLTGSPIPDKSLDQKHLTTLAVVTEGQDKLVAEDFKRIGLRRLGTINQAHSSTGRLTIYIAGGEFKFDPDFIESQRSSNVENKGT